MPNEAFWRWPIPGARTPGPPPGGMQVLSPAMPKPPQGYFNGGWPVPQLNRGMTFYDVGTSGLRQFGGWVREEYLPQLVGRQAARAYREMLDNSATIGSIMFSILASMRKVEWRVESADDSPDGVAAQEFVDECRDDMSHTWSDFVVESLSMLGYGYAPHELVYKRRLGRNPGFDPQTGKRLPQSKFDDGKIGWRRIPLRGQDTVIKWFFGEAGEILGVTQQPWIGPLVDIPIEKMLLFRPSSHKNNPEGRSILRNSYRSYYFVKRMEEQEAIMFERLSGVPVIKIPGELFDAAAAGDANAAAKIAAYKTIVTNLRIDEQMGLLLPSDMWPGTNGPSPQEMYKFELVAPPSPRGTSTSDVAIRRYSINMMTSVLADFLQLGHESRGTQSLAVSKVDMFFQAIEGFLNSNADVMNRYGLPRLWELNGLDYECMPRVIPDLAQRLDLDVLSNYVMRLAQSGMPMFPDPELETWIRDAAGMPDVSDEAAAAFARLEDAGQDDDDATLGDPTGPNAEPAPQPQNQRQKGRRDLHTMLRGAIARRLKTLNGAVGRTTSSKRKRRRKRARSVQTAPAADHLEMAGGM